MSFINTRTLLKELNDALIALEWTPEGGAAENVFDSVAFYDTGKVYEALDKLFSYKASMAVIVPAGVTFRNQHNVTHLDSEKSLVVTVFFTGRSYKTEKMEDFLGMKRQGEAYVINEEKLGILGMVDAVVDGISGREFAGAGPMEPVEGDDVGWGEKDGDKIKSLRKGYYLTFECKAGEKEFLIV